MQRWKCLWSISYYCLNFAGEVIHKAQEIPPQEGGIYSMSFDAAEQFLSMTSWNQTFQTFALTPSFPLAKNPFSSQGFPSSTSITF